MPNPPSSGLPRPAHYAADEQVVTDGVTGLVWQRQVDPQLRAWDDAKRYCACLRLAGERDWRLPSRIELVSLVDFNRVSPSLDGQIFPETTDENFWTASPVGINPGLVYLVFFLNGHTTYSQFDYEYRTRCVRSSAKAKSERYTFAGGSVHDTQTELTWQRAIPTTRANFADSQAYCAGLALDGGGWRLPSINELQTLVDETHNPSIDTAAFPDTPSEYFWSSSLVIEDPTRAWTAFFTNGSTYPASLTASKYVRCLR
jgi:hypothetical protein